MLVLDFFRKAILFFQKSKEISKIIGKAGTRFNLRQGNNILSVLSTFFMYFFL